MLFATSAIARHAWRWMRDLVAIQREDLKVLRQARDAGDNQTVEERLRRMEQLLDRTSD